MGLTTSLYMRLVLLCTSKKWGVVEMFNTGPKVTMETVDLGVSNDYGTPWFLLCVAGR